MENTEKQYPLKIWETIYDLSYLAGRDKLTETDYYDNDSRELYVDIQKWAMEFEDKFNFDFDCSGFNYLVEIDKFYIEKRDNILKECNSLNND